jgi:two-component system chemotaxis sensor kinase CheA
LSTRQFQNEIIKLKLVPLSTIFDLFPRLVRDAARETGKDINLIIKGRDVELDKVVVEKLKEILIHILNNAAGHGCETPAVREKLGKPKTGNIILSAYNKGDNVILEISDDGQGINIDRVKEKAIERGFITKEAATNAADDDIIPFIFETGFSTAAVSKLSGRGIGMDIVAKVVKDLNGDIKVKTWKNKGTTFVISLPLISFFIPVTIFSLGERLLGFPSTYIMSTLRVNQKDIKQVAKDHSVIRMNNLEISLIDLSRLFYNNTENTDVYKNIILVQYQDEVAGFIVTDIIIEKKMVIKKITGLLNQLKLVIGAVLLGNERAIPILNVAELFKVLKDGASSLAKVTDQDMNKEKIWAKNVLLVDDSPITRDQEKQILLAQHLNVFEAANGKEALKLLEAKKFDIMITDIEMPVMDGVSLVKAVKADARLAQLPVIVVSSYKEYQNKLYELGVNHFIDKNSFNSQILMDVLKEEKIL